MPWQGQLGRIHASPNCWMLGRAALFPVQLGPSQFPGSPALSTRVMCGKRQKCTLSFQLVPQIRLDIKSQVACHLCSHIRAVSTCDCLCPHSHSAVMVVWLRDYVNGTPLFLSHLAMRSATFFLKGTSCSLP